MKFKAVISGGVGLYLALGLPITLGAEARGPVTNFPMPRFVSLNDSEAYLRRGPSKAHRIDWIYLRNGLPLMIIDEYDHWRRVRDRDGITGWIYRGLLSGARTAIIEPPTAVLRASPNPDAQIRAIAEQNAILRIISCVQDWCKLSAQGLKGWVLKSEFWGAFKDEKF